MTKGSECHDGVLRADLHCPKGPRGLKHKAMDGGLGPKFKVSNVKVSHHLRRQCHLALVD